MLGLQVQVLPTGSGDPNPGLYAYAAGTLATTSSAGHTPFVGVGVGPGISHQLSKCFTTELCPQLLRSEILSFQVPVHHHGTCPAKPTAHFSGRDQTRCHTVHRASPAAAVHSVSPRGRKAGQFSPQCHQPWSLGVISFIGHVKGRLWHRLFYLKNESPMLAVTGEVDREHCGKQAEGCAECLAQPHAFCTGAPESLALAHPATGGCTSGLTFGIGHCMC